MRVESPLHSAPLHWGVADRRETPRDARQHTWRTRHGARDGFVRRDLWFMRTVPGLGRRAGTIASTPSQPAGAFMQTLLISTATVALAEIGDKTQLLSLILAA